MNDITKIEKPSAWELFRQSMYVGMQFYCFRYLMSNAHGRWDGAEKAHNHIQLCSHFVAAVKGCHVDSARLNYEDEFQLVHQATRVLTDNLDTEIDFPLDSRPDYDDLAPKFFDRFFELATAALELSENTQPDAWLCSNKLNGVANIQQQKTSWVISSKDSSSLSITLLSFNKEEGFNHYTALFRLPPGAEALCAENDLLRKLLDSASNSLRWYQEEYPNRVSKTEYQLLNQIDKILKGDIA